jgi:hypothetical protein
MFQLLMSLVRHAQEHIIKQIHIVGGVRVNMKSEKDRPILKCLGLLTAWPKCRHCYINLAGVDPQCSFWQEYRIDYSIKELEICTAPWITWMQFPVVLESGVKIPIRVELMFGTEGEIMLCDYSCCNREDVCEPNNLYRPGEECCRVPWNLMQGNVK